MSTKHMTGYTHVHLPLVSNYSWVLCIWQDSLTSITHMTGFTREYKVHDRSYSRVLSTYQQSLASSVLLVSHEPNTQVIFKFSRSTNRYSRFFVNLDMSCTVKSLSNPFITCKCILNNFAKSCSYTSTNLYFIPISLLRYSRQHFALLQFFLYHNCFK